MKIQEEKIITTSNNKKFSNYKDIAKNLLKFCKIAYKKSKKVKLESNKKGVKDIVTSKDLFLENFLIDKIKSYYGNVNFVSEETNFNNKLDGVCFVIDPIDGTRNFANGIKIWAMQVACVIDGDVVASAMFSPVYGEFYAAKGYGAFEFGKKYSVNDIEKQGKLVALHSGIFDKKAKMLKLINDKYTFRITGCTSLNLLWVSQGKYSLCIEEQPINLWDYLPGKLFCTEAGAYFKMTKNFLYASPNKKDLNDILKKFIENGIED